MIIFFTLFSLSKKNKKGTKENHAKNPKPQGCWDMPISIAEILERKKNIH